MAGHGRAALVTGASSGIGRELALLFGGAGFDLILTARREEALERLAREIRAAKGVTVTVLPADLSDPKAVPRLYQRVRDSRLPVQVLVNNAGFGARGGFAKLGPERQMAMLQVNVMALTQLTRLVLPGMLERRRGRILNLASTAAFQPGPMMAVYYASKAYVLSFSEALSEELSGSGVTVTCLCPGPTETGFAAAAGMGSRVMRRLGAMSVTEVARAGFEGAMAGRRLVIPGVRNKLGAASVRFSPRGLLLKVVKQLQSE